MDCQIKIFAAFVILVLTWNPSVGQDINKELVGYLNLAVENFRSEMKNGIKSIKMPILDPLVLDRISVHESGSVATINMEIPHLKLSGLSSFKSDIKFNLEELEADITLVFGQDVKANGQYSIDGKLIKIFPVYGKGGFDIAVSKGYLHLNGKLKGDEGDIGLKLKALELKWEGLQLHLENFMGGGKISELLHTVVPLLAGKILDLINPMLLKEINKAVNELLAKEMSKPSVQEFLQNMLGGGRE